MIPVEGTCRAAMVFPGLLRSQAGDLQAVFESAVRQSLQASQLGLIGRDDQLAADLIRDALLLREGHHGCCTGAAHEGLLGARNVVQARMNHSGVPAGLVQCPVSTLLHHGDARGRLLPRKPLGDRQSDDAAPNDEIPLCCAHLP